MTNKKDLLDSFIDEFSGTSLLEILHQNGIPEEEFLAHSGDLEDFLAHYGVKGMKWGVRKDRQVFGVSNLMSDSGQVRVAVGLDKSPSETEIDDVATATYNLNRDLISKHRAKLVKTMQDVDSKYDPWAMANDDKHVAKYNSEMSKALTSFVQKRAPKGAKVVVTSVDESLINLMVGTPSWHKEYLALQAKHDALSEVITTPIKLIRDSDGKLTDFELEVFEHSEHLEDFLAHYGVKGMKWGVRRSDAELARNRGESPSSSTKKKSKSLKDRVSSVRKKVAPKGVAEGEPTKEELKKAKAGAGEGDLSADADRHLRTSLKSGHQLSNQEIQAFINRANNIQAYNKLVNPPTPTRRAQLEEKYKELDFQKKIRDINRELNPPKVSAVQRFLKTAEKGFETYEKLNKVSNGKLGEAVGKAFNDLSKSSTETTKTNSSNTATKARKAKVKTRKPAGPTPTSSKPSNAPGRANDPSRASSSGPKNDPVYKITNL